MASSTEKKKRSDERMSDSFAQSAARKFWATLLTAALIYLSHLPKNHNYSCRCFGCSGAGYETSPGRGCGRRRAASARANPTSGIAARIIVTSRSQPACNKLRIIFRRWRLHP